MFVTPSHQNSDLAEIDSKERILYPKTMQAFLYPSKKHDLYEIFILKNTVTGEKESEKASSLFALPHSPKNKRKYNM